VKQVLTFLMIAGLLFLPRLSNAQATDITAHPQTSEPIQLKRPEGLIKPITPPERDEESVPLIITADGSLDWDREKKTFIARDNAMAEHGESNIRAALLKAEYRDGQNGNMEISHVTAQDNVIIETRDSKAYGQLALYNLDTGKASMTGNNLRLVSPDQTVTARDRFEYHVPQGKLMAIGAAKVVRPKPQGGGTDTLQADTIAATMKTNAKGERVLHTLEAIGRVVITTPAETITGARGIYRASNNMAELIGDVTIRRGPNILEGERAVVDMNTNTSRLFGAPTPQGSGRVRGVFYPGSAKGQ